LKRSDYPRAVKVGLPHCAPDGPGRLGAQESAHAGFSLLELVVALTMIGLIAAAAFGGLRLGTRAWESGDRKTNAVAQSRLAQGFLRRQIAAAYPLVLESELAEKQVAFRGLPERVTFIASLAAHLGRGGLYRLTLGFVEEGDTGRLIMRRRLHQPDWDFFEDAQEQDTTTVLVGGIERAVFSYFGRSRPGGQASWHDTWQDRTVLPLLVRLDVTYADRRRAEWPQLIIAPMIDMDAGCVFDTVARKCRNR
jgi:general secretion pathway protein J